MNMDILYPLDMIMDPTRIEPFRAQIDEVPLDGSDEIAMEAPSSALQPHQVSVITCGFADPTIGTMARSHSSLD